MSEESKLEFDKPYKMNIIKKAMISTQVLFDLLVHNKLDEIDKLLDYKLPKRIIQATDHFNNSILMSLLSAGHLKLAGKLITYFDEYIVYDQLNDNQNNVLHICCQKNNFMNHYKYKALIEFFIKKLPSSLNLHNDVFKTPFFYSIENLDLHTFKTLSSLKLDNFTQKDIFSYNLFHGYYQHFNQLYASIYRVDEQGALSIHSFEDIDETLHAFFEKLMSHNELLYEVDEQNLTPFTYALKYVANDIYSNMDNSQVYNNNNSTNSANTNINIQEKQHIAHEHFIYLFEKQMLSIIKSMEHYFLHFNQHIDSVKNLEQKLEHKEQATNNLNIDNPTSSSLSILNATPKAVHGHHHENQFNLMKNNFILDEGQLLHMAKIVHDVALLKEKQIKQNKQSSFQMNLDVDNLANNINNITPNHINSSININIYEEFHTMLLTFMASEYYQTHKKSQLKNLPNIYEPKNECEEIIQ